MNKSSFDKLMWGFLFIMIDIRIQGFDILPDVIGYILFAVGFSHLAVNSEYFKKVIPLNVIMMAISTFSLYEKPAQGEGIHFSLLMFISLINLVLGLMVVYYLFMGIKDMAENQGNNELYEEAGKRWLQFLILQLAVFAVFILIVLPALVSLFIIALFIATLVLTFVIMGFMRRCGENLS